VKVILDKFGIQKGMMTTIHAYTTTQRLLDLASKDLRRARAAALNIIPTTTGAAKLVGRIIPEVAGKIDAYSLRVPIPTVSVTDIVVQTEKDVTIEEINAALKEAAEGPMKGILGYCEEPLVSVDYKGDPRSSVIDAALTNVIVGNMVKVVAWYDNEWGYSCRTADLAAMIAKTL
jgi:glyceraldehyde 3-phosphate dehydrogenase